jgi:putative ABC transport system substrate-binding protein
MRRRDVIALLSAALAVLPRRVFAQQGQGAPRVARIGVLNYAAERYSRVEDFRRELRVLGHVEGQNLYLIHKWAEGRSERLPELAAELINGGVDVMIALGPAAWAAKRATSTVPIVIAFSGDLVGTGMVSNLARPGGNVTGFSYMSTELAGKRLQLLAETFSKTGRIAVLYSPAEPATALEMEQTQSAAQTLGITLVPVIARHPNDFEPAFATASREGADAVVAFTHGLVELNRERLIDVAARHRLPTMYGWRDFVVAGGLMSYGPDVQALVRKAASYVDRIIKGERPGDLPVEQPTRLELVVNQKAARSLGLSIAPTLLARADEVIE